MANYVKRTLSEGEKVIMDAKFHWIKYFWPTFWILISAFWLFIYKFTGSEEDALWLLVPFFFCLYGVFRILVLMSDEVTLTNQRLVAKRGLFSRRTLDLQLSEVESVTADLPFLLSRLFGTGRIIISGTGGSRMSVPYVDKILNFRKIVQKTLNEKRTHAGVVPLERMEQQNNNKFESSEKIDLLLKLKCLLDGGVISMEEFQRERDNIMSKKS